MLKHFSPLFEVFIALVMQLKILFNEKKNAENNFLNGFEREHTFLLLHPNILPCRVGVTPISFWKGERHGLFMTVISPSLFYMITEVLA